jgi:hypothetical protein
MTTSNHSSSTLTGKAKAGYFFLGMFLAVIGVLIAWFVNRGRPAATEAIKMSAVGFIVSFIICFAAVFIIFFLPLIVSASL